MLRARRERPCRCCAAKHRDEPAPIRLVELHTLPLAMEPLTA
jgi:hypothetical protein